ncbi:MAG: 3-dehydroquinate synthase, partial [Gammaproteobacteria bacterium]|nr:3-dehydroquinate synthase [Gammaproteobacteria bacterium]
METRPSTLTVELGDRSYPIYIGSGLIDQQALYSAHIPSKQALIVSNETVAPIYLQRVLSALTDFDTAEVILPDGEQYKNLEIWQTIFDTLLEKRFDRQSTVI